MQLYVLVIRFAYCLVLALLVGCTHKHAIDNPQNPSGKFYGTTGEQGEYINHLSQSEQVYASDLNCTEAEFAYRAPHFRADKPVDSRVLGGPKGAGTGQIEQIFNEALPLSTGDMVDVYIEDGDGFSGRYVVSPAGRLNIPYISPVLVSGLSEVKAAEAVEFALIKEGLFKPQTAAVSVRVLQWAPIEVVVSGAVFEPGRIRINENIQDSVITERVSAFGDYAARRSLAEALRAASGIRPDAKLDQILLLRNGWQLEVDMSGVLTGSPVNDVSLVANDQVIVPTSGCFQPELVRPSQITPKGFRVFMSNLIVPALNNASGAVGRFSSSMPYGTRLLQAAVSANCVGGTQLTNAPRRVVLASKNPLTGEFQVVERSVEQLMRQAHIDEINPYMMPNDAVACYDSDISNIRDIARSLTEIITPILLL